MWIVIGMLGGAIAGTLARRLRWVLGGAICLLPFAAWFIAVVGAVGPGMTDSNYPQFMLALLGIMIGVSLPHLLGWKHRHQTQSPSPEP